MLPHLRVCDEDGALLAAMREDRRRATPEHAQKLQLARQIDAAVGLIGGPLAFVFLVGAAAWSWVRYGKDPVYLDDPSIHIPAPPPDLTAASGAVVWEGRATRRALTTAMLDLASRGELAFREESGLLGINKKAGIQVTVAPNNDPYVIRNRRRPLSEAENYALARVRSIAGPAEGYYIAADDITKFGKYTASFDKKIEQHVTDKGWFREPPDKAISRWRTRGVWILILGGVALFAGFQILPSAGLTILGGFLIAAGIAMTIISGAMPARTMAGAMIYAMLAAYRRTLQKTMEQARSMEQVVAEAKLPWLETPDQAVVWGTALGLQKRHRERPHAQRRGRTGRHDPARVVPGLVRHGLLRRRRSPAARRDRARPVLVIGDPRFRRDDVRARHHRQLAQLERVGQLGWLLGRWRRWRRRRRRRRLLEAPLRASIDCVMGAVETMQEFFEHLNDGDRQSAVNLMDEKAEMRVHVPATCGCCAASSRSAAGSCAPTRASR